MSWLEKIGFKTGITQMGSVAIEQLFPLNFQESVFIATDVENIFARILNDVLERTIGIPDEEKALLWDNCVASESSNGLVSMLSKAMYNKSELYLVYKKELKLIRHATSEETEQIKAAYKTGKQKSGQVYISFKNFNRSDFMKLYSHMEYCTIASLSKQMNLSKAVLFKMADLRKSVGASDSDDVIAQAQAVAEALRQGDDSLIDAGDSLEIPKPDLSATVASMEFINQKRSFYLGVPASYITGLAPKGLGDSGIGEAKQVERGLKGYYFPIVKPVTEALFGVKTEFKSDDMEKVLASLELMTTFEATSEELVSVDEKRVILRRALGLPDKMKAADLKLATDPKTAGVNNDKATTGQ